MADYSYIPKGVARKIAVEHLNNLEDVESFGEVCSFWRSEIRDVNYRKFRPSSNTQLPSWLMLADSPTSSYRRFYSLSKGMYCKIDLPQFDSDPEDHRRYFSSKGWLIGVSRKQGLINFYDPFSGTVINPPSVPIREFIDGDIWDDKDYLYQFAKFIFSNDNRCDNHNTNKDFQVAMIFDKYNYITFWRPGQKKWVQPDMGFDNRKVKDACFFRGEFYAIDQHSRVIAYRSQQEPMRLPRIVANLCSQGLVGWAPSRLYIVVSGISTLLVIDRFVIELAEQNGEYYLTESFELVELNVDTREARRVEEIGNRALFVGYSSTFFVEVETSSPLLNKQRGCRPNCIYFTDDNSPRGGGANMGIYSLEERKVIDHVYQGPSQFDPATPPIWIELPHC